MNDYYSVRVDASPCNEDITDVIAAFLADVGFESFVPDETGVTAFISSRHGNGKNIALMALQDFPIECELSVSEEYIEGRDWNEEWEKNYFKPIMIGNECVIHSSFHRDVPSAQFDILIDPKMAFGTGHHDTTSQMVKFILKADIAGKSVIDMGTGTGILGILAAKRGAAKVTGIEIDEAAFENALENINLNNVDMTAVLGDADALSDLEEADFIFANINRNIILADIDKYSSKLKPGGYMFLSGFYIEDMQMIVDKASKYGLIPTRHLVSNRWTALQLSKNF